MKYANGRLEHAEKLRAAQRPAILQHDVVLLLNANAGEFAKNVQTVGQILKLDRLDLPVRMPMRNDSLECDSGVAMSPTAIVEEDMNFLHRGDCAMGLGARKGAHFMLCG